MRSHFPRKFLIAIWLILIGLLIVNGVNFLLLLRTGIPLVGTAAGMGLPVPESLRASQGAPLILVGDVSPGYGFLPDADEFTLMLAGAWLILIAAGSVMLHRSIAAAQPGDWIIDSWRLKLSRSVVMCCAGLLTAGVLATLLEIAGLWKKLNPAPDPKQEQGAPYWLWWILAGVAILAWYLWLRKSNTNASTGRLWVSRLSSLAITAVLLIAVALLLHAIRPEPTQGRYYGIPGFVVGREQNYEYGTYYGMVAGTIVMMLSLVQFAFTLLSVRIRPRLLEQL